MADQRVVQPLGIVENIQVKTGGAKFSVSFLVLDVGDAYSMLLGRPWLKIAEAIHEWTTNTITLRSKGKKVFLNTNPKQVNETQKPELLCQKQTPKQIEKMLASLDIVPTAEIDLNVILADMEKVKEQRELFPERFQESMEGTRPISKLGRVSGKDENLTKQKCQRLPASSEQECHGIVANHPNEESDDEDQTMQEKGANHRVVEEPVWMVPDDQEIEEWNLNTDEEPKTIRVNKNLPNSFKAEARKVFTEYKDVFAWEHDDLKGVDPKVCQHRIPLIPDAKPI